jgi:hypothetical protein
MKLRPLALCFSLLLISSLAFGQAITASLQGGVFDKTGAVLTNATVSATNTETGLARSVKTNGAGEYEIRQLPVGQYKVSAEAPSFQPQSRALRLVIGQAANLDFTLAPGTKAEELTVTTEAPLVEVTRTSVDSVIGEEKIQNLPVNGRQFIDFALLAPGVIIGDTTSGSTDVIIEPVTKLSFAGQNIHYNFIAVDGADNISTASGVQKTTPSEEAVREFRVINNTYSVEAGRAVGGIVNIITKSGANDVHGSLYEYLRNDAFDAKSILAAPGLNKLRQNQFGFTSATMRACGAMRTRITTPLFWPTWHPSISSKRISGSRPSNSTSTARATMTISSSSWTTLSTTASTPFSVISSMTAA